MIRAEMREYRDCMLENKIRDIMSKRDLRVKFFQKSTFDNLHLCCKIKLQSIEMDICEQRSLEDSRI